MISSTWLDAIAFNKDGLIPAIAQDKDSGDILMMAWMNRDALTLTAQTKTAVYFSRSRNQLWHKGETSGHTQHVHDIYLDCDADALILNVTQVGGIACHTGRRSCFYRRLTLEHTVSTDSAMQANRTLTNSTPLSWETVAPVIKDPAHIYGDNAHSDTSVSKGDKDDSQSLQATSPTTNQAGDILTALDAVLVARKKADADSSYVASLYGKGLNKILEKVGEEAIESILAAKELQIHSAASHTALTEDNPQVNDLVYEIADVWFHTLVTLAWFDIGSDTVLQELARRFGLSGITEKNSR